MLEKWMGRKTKVDILSGEEDKPPKALWDWDYSPAPEATDWVKIDPQQKMFINGRFTLGTGENQSFTTINPATGETLAQIPEASEKDVNEAVQAAQNCFSKTWSKVSGAERARYLFRIARIIQDRSRELAILESLDNGKPIKESRDIDIPLVAAHFFYYAGWADKLNYAFQGRSHRPLGVAAQIIPWNFPLMMAAWKIAPALATGNCVVLKPAETTSLTALRLAEIFQQAGLPEGVVNIVTGSGQVGAQLVDHPQIQKVAFTGSTSVGKVLAQKLSGRQVPLTFELGGKSAQIVYADAAIDQAVEGIVKGIYFNQGHVCSAGSRLLLEESVSEVFLRKLKKRMGQIRVGDPLDKNTDVGAINSQAEYDKIQAYINMGKDEGLEFYEASANALPQKGFFHKPCLFEDVSPSSTLYRQEIFGPVLTVSTFRTPEEAVSKANDSCYGLAAGIWSEKSAKVQWTAQRLRAGVIWANTYNRFDPASPFGGYKESGWGREGGLQGLLPYVEVSP